MASILVIDDDFQMSAMMAKELVYSGHEVEIALSLAEGRQKARLGHPDIVFLDVRMPDGNGIEALPEIKDSPSDPEIIVITGFADADSAETAILSGAWDYLQKPFSQKEMHLSLLRALRFREEKEGRGRERMQRRGIIGRSVKIRQCLDLLLQASRTDINALITGESGTGKELFAAALHENSPRAAGNFVVVDCTVLPENLVEGLLFGHRKGAFTGAAADQEGLVRQAHKGTLFLDEIGELPLSFQKTLLRVIQERSFRPIGARKEEQSDFRLIAATNRDLLPMVREGIFREDLLYRLRGVHIHLPPLRERREDIPDLVKEVMAEFCHQYGMDEKQVAPEVMDAFLAYSWPGNVRELRHTLDRMLTVARQETALYFHHLPTHIRVFLVRQSIGRREPSPDTAGCEPLEPERLPGIRAVRRSAVEKAEKEYLALLLAHCRGDMPEICRIAGLSRSQIYSLLKKYHLLMAGASPGDAPPGS